LLVNPWGELAALELIALLGPFLLVIPKRVWREAFLAIGLPLLTLLWLANPADGSAMRLLTAWAVFSIGVLMTARVLEGQRDLASLVGRVTFDDPRDANDIKRERPTTDQRENALRGSIERELARARRHDRHFAVLSASIRLRSAEADSVGLQHNMLMRSLAENRARLELFGLMRDELHLYCDIVVAGRRVLALVPEVDGDELQGLLARLDVSADETLDFDVEFGVGCFPADAVCAEELIASADRARKTSKLVPVPEQAAIDSHPRDALLRSPDVRG
jgi:hypothetical protein